MVWPFKKKRSVPVDDLMSTFETFGYGGNYYPLAAATPSYGNTEEAPNDFTGYAQHFFKSDGIVYACMVTRQTIFSEARFTWQRLENGRPGDMFGTRDLEILENPWPGATTGDMMARAIQDVDLAGNAYVVREGGRLRRLRPDWVEIILSAPPAEAVQSDVIGYKYSPGGVGTGGDYTLYTAEEVAHWAPTPDPEAQYRGMSWLTPVINEVMADKSATAHKLNFFRNAATPNISVSLKETVTEEQFRDFMRAFNEAQEGTPNAYKTLFLGGGADVKVIGADLRQLDFKATQGAGETRIAAAARVHPSLVGLAEGMQGSSLNAGNFRATRDSFADGTLRPLWRGFASSLQTLIPPPAGCRLWYDDRDIPFLRADKQELAEIHNTETTMITKLIQSGYEEGSIIEAIRADCDWEKLRHTGNLSVQLLPPKDQALEDQIKVDEANTSVSAQQASTMATLVTAGFEPKSVVAAVKSGNWNSLKVDPAKQKMQAQQIKAAEQGAKAQQQQPAAKPDKPKPKDDTAPKK